jgi:hypothetical protein
MTCRYIFLLILSALLAVGCASQTKKKPAKPLNATVVSSSDVLLGRLERPTEARAAADAWRSAVEKGDRDWMDGLERRYAYPLTRLALSLSLDERSSVFGNWESGVDELLIQRMGTGMVPEEAAIAEDWKKQYMDQDYDAALETAMAWKVSSPTGNWMKLRAQVLALFNMRRFHEAAEMLEDTERYNEVLGRRDRLLQVDCMRRSGRLADSREAWNKLTEAALRENDDYLVGPLLEAANSLQSVSTQPVDKGRIVTLAERAEANGDLALAWNAYQTIWSDPLLPCDPEALSARSAVIRRAGLGALRIISGELGHGNYWPKMKRWTDQLEHVPMTKGRLFCECELKRFETAVFLKNGQLAHALVKCQEAATLAEQTGDVVLITRARGDLAVVLAHTGQLEEAQHTVEAACRAARASGDPELIYETQRNKLVILAGMAGETPDALLESVMTQAKRLGHLDPDEALAMIR